MDTWHTLKLLLKAEYEYKIYHLFGLSEHNVFFNVMAMECVDPYM